MLRAAAFLIAVSGAQDARIRDVIGRLGGDFLEERAAAADELRRIGQPAEALLVDHLGSGDPRVRSACLDLLVSLKSTLALSRATEMFRSDEDPGVRDAAFRLFESVGAPAEEPMISALGHGSAEFRRRAIQGLSELRSAKCVPAMTQLYEREPERGLKEAAFRCLVGLGKPAEPFLVTCLASPDPVVRREALSGLKDPGLEAVAATGRLFATETDRSVLQRAYDLLESAGPSAGPHFLAALRSPSEEGRRRALEGLKGLRSEAALVPAGELLLRDPSDPVRAAAVDLLKAHGLKSEEPLLAAFRSDAPAVRMLAMQALGEIRSEKPLAEIAKIFREDPEPNTHRRAFEYLRDLGARAERELAAALDDPNNEIRREAVEALGEGRCVSVVPRLIGFLVEFNFDLRQAAELALVQIGPPALEAVEAAVREGKLKPREAESLRALYHQEEVERRLDALVTDVGGSGFFEGQFAELKALGADKAVPVLLQILTDTAHRFRRMDRRQKVLNYELRMRETAVSALGEIGGERALQPLREALRAAPPPGAGEGVYEELLVALHRLGDKAPLDEFVRSARADARKGLDGDAKYEGGCVLWSLGLVLHRARRWDEAADVYLELAKAIDHHRIRRLEAELLQTVYYNLGCARSLQGRKAEALDWLDKAVAAGYADRTWMALDRDLDPIRGEERFRKLLTEQRPPPKNP